MFSLLFLVFISIFDFLSVLFFHSLYVGSIPFLKQPYSGCLFLDISKDSKDSCTGNSLIGTFFLLFDDNSFKKFIEAV